VLWRWPTKANQNRYASIEEDIYNGIVHSPCFSYQCQPRDASKFFISFHFTPPTPSSPHRPTQNQSITADTSHISTSTGPNQNLSLPDSPSHPARPSSLSCCPTGSTCVVPVWLIQPFSCYAGPKRAGVQWGLCACLEGKGRRYKGRFGGESAGLCLAIKQ